MSNSRLARAMNEKPRVVFSTTLEAAAPAGIDDCVVVVGVVTLDVEREGRVAQFTQGDGLAVGQGVGGGDGEDDGLVLEGLDFQVGISVWMAPLACRATAVRSRARRAARWGRRVTGA